MAAINAGALRERLEVLELTRSERDGVETWSWESVRRTWARAEVSDKTCLFSSVGIGARRVVFTLRRQDLTLHQAFRWKGQHCFLTSIVPDGLDHLTVTAALVDIVDCLAGAGEAAPGPRFPGVLTEKYLKHEQETPMAVNTLTYVLVTPKAAALESGSLTEVDGVPYEVQVAHTLDRWKNEYEIVRVVDL